MVRLTVLTDKEVEAIHQATLRILSEVGIVLTQSEARAILTGAGATVHDDRVLLPPDLVEQEVARCPKQVAIHGRREETILLGDGDLHWHNLGGAPNVYDPRAGRHRRATLQDVRDSARLLDALESVTTITPFFTPHDVPGPLMSLAMYRHSLPCATKPVQGPGVQTAAEVCYAVRMAAVIGPPAKVLSLGISPVSPLTFPDDVAEATIETARQAVPLGPLPCPTAGATAPMSLAGSLAQQNAEVLASAVLAQLVQPGLPIIYCGRLAMMEPRSGLSVWGGVELGLASAATVQIGHRYGLPVNVYGLSTNAHELEIERLRAGAQRRHPRPGWGRRTLWRWRDGGRCDRFLRPDGLRRRDRCQCPLPATRFFGRRGRTGRRDRCGGDGRLAQLFGAAAHGALSAGR